MDAHQLAQARQLAARLERLSADSHWAHRASGLRGALLRSLEQAEAGEVSRQVSDELESLLQSGYEILNNAAREIEEPK